METFLTLVIAVGGIATGIGAIWAALAARRQAQKSERQAQLTEKSLTEQRQAFQEQTEIARRQAQVTEQRLTEQNERARLNLEADLLFRMVDRFNSPFFLRRRRRTAKYIKETFFVDDDILEVQRLNDAAMEVGNFFEQLGYFQRLGALRPESVSHTFGVALRAIWTLYEPAIESIREEWEDSDVYEEFERLNSVVADLERERNIAPPTKEQLRQLVEWEAALSEESLTPAWGHLPTRG